MATISQRISLEGGEDIRKQLEELAKAAASAFSGIKAAANKIEIDSATQKSFADLANAGSKLAEQFGELGQAASKSAPQIEEVGKTAETAGKGFAKVGEEGAKAAEGIAAVGDASQKTATTVTASGEAAEKSSAGYANLALNVVKTGASVVTAGAGITSAGAATAAVGVQAVGAAAAVGTFALSLGSTLATGIGAAVAALALLASALERIAFSDAKLADTLQRLVVSSKTVGQGFTDLQVGQAAFEQIGISAEKFRSVIANIARELATFDAGSAFKKSADEIDAASIRALETEKKLLELRHQPGATQRIAEIDKQLDQLKKAKELTDAVAASEGARAANLKALANDLGKIVEMMQQFDKSKLGLATAFDPLTTAETKLEAVKVRLQDVAKAGGDVGQSLLNLIANLPKEDAFQIGKAFGLSETDIDRVRRYGAEVTKIDNLYTKIRAGGVLISPSTADTFDRMNESSQRLDSAWERLKQAWASTIFSSLAAGATTAFNNITARVVEFAAQAVESFNMLGSQLMTTLGQIGSFGASTFSKIGQGLAIIGSGIANLVTKAAGGAWQWIGDTFNAAVAGIASAASSVASSILAFVTTAPGAAWQWIKDTFNLAVAGIASAASSVASSILTFVTTAPGAAWEWIKDTFNAAVAGIITKAGEAQAFIMSWVTTAVPGAWDWLKDKFFSIVDAIINKARSSGLFGGGGGAATPAPAAAGGGTFAGGGLLGGRGTGTSDSNLAWVSRGEYIIPARIVRQPGMLAFLEALRLQRFAGGGSVGSFAEGGQVGADKVVSVLAKVRQLVDGVAQTLARLTFTMIDGMQGMMKNINDLMKTFSDVINGVIAGPLKQASDALFDFENSLKGHAGGGLLGGRGTGTSDSNLAWVSRGEHIMPARAVAQPGVLAFLEALRRSGGNLRDVLDGMGRFALGGMVRAPLAIPAFAGGGGMHAVTIQFPGLPEITGLRASSAVVDELRKAAAMAQVRSGGRKPSRYS